MSYTRLLYHIVFRPKNSIPAITEKHEECLYKYIWGFIKRKNGVLYRINSMPDHIHMLVQLPPSSSLSDFMRDLKTATNKYMNEEKDKFPLFSGWGKSYCAYSCSASDITDISDYIKTQKEHHKKTNLHDELLKISKECGINIEMKYFLKE